MEGLSIVITDNLNLESCCLAFATRGQQHTMDEEELDELERLLQKHPHLRRADPRVVAFAKRVVSDTKIFFLVVGEIQGGEQPIIGFCFQGSAAYS